MKSEELKQIVKEKYGKIAEQNAEEKSVLRLIMLRT